MKKHKIILTVIKESDGSFSAIGYLGKNHEELIVAQGDTWDELKESALDAVNQYLTDKGRTTITPHKIDFSFDLPSFLDAYPLLDASALAKEKDVNTRLSGRKVSGKKKAAERQLHRILAAVKQLRNKSSKLSA